MSFAVGIANTNLQDTAEVDNSVTITATLGNVNVFAKGSNKSGTSSSTFAPVDATAGTSISVTFDNSNVQSLLNGTITAGGTISGGKQATFNSSDPNTVDITTGVIHIPNHGLTNGELVTYTPQNLTNLAGGGTIILPSTPLGGLVSGSSYYVLYVDANDIQLTNVPPITLNPSGTDPNSTQTLSVTNADTFSVDAVDPQ